MEHKKKIKLGIGLFSAIVMIFATIMGATAEFCSPFTLNMTINPSSMTMSDGCSGDVSLAPDSDDLVWVRLINNANGSVVYEQSYGSGFLGDSDTFNFYPSSAIQGGYYYLNISWERIRYDDMSNPSLNGKADKGEIQHICGNVSSIQQPRPILTDYWMNYKTTGAFNSDCTWEGWAYGGGTTSEWGATCQSATPFPQGFYDLTGCNGVDYVGQCNGNWYRSPTSTGVRTTEGVAYQPTFTCQIFASHYYVDGGFGCLDLGANYGTGIYGCSNPASSPLASVCDYAGSHSIRSNVFSIIYNSNSKPIVDFDSVGLDLSGSLDWVSITEECFTDGFYNFVPDNNIIVDESDPENPVLKLNITITDNQTLIDNPSNCTPVVVTIVWYENGVPTNCNNFCPNQTITINNTGAIVTDGVPIENLNPESNYSVEVEYQQDGGEAVYSEPSDDDFYADPNIYDFPEPCGDGFCDAGIGETAFTCGIDCNPSLQGVVGAGSPAPKGVIPYIDPTGEGIIGTGQQYLYTGDGFTFTEGGSVAYGYGGLDWEFIFINNVVIN